MNKIKLRNVLQQFFLEDIGDVDLTSELIFPLNKKGSGEFLVKKNGILSGLEVIKEGYALFDPSIEVVLHKKDGDKVEKGEKVATVDGPVAHLLSAERVILNLLQRMSGVATATQNAVMALNSQKTRICDTRKTMPGLRMLDKYAVRCGGGYNHRFGLYDGVMIKDNHIAFMGSIAAAVSEIRSQLGHMVKVEVEVEKKEEVLEATEAGADVIMFDNCSPEDVEAFVRLVPDHIITEASGGISLDNIAAYRDTGVDYISLGILTHSTEALDISFNLRGGKKNECTGHR